MHNQCLPTIFESHKDWLLEAINSRAIPTAWIFKGDCWELQTSCQSSGQIEEFEHTLLSQKNIGVIRFTATLDVSKEDYTIAYLYDGTHFSHTIFQPRDKPNTTSLSAGWWIESWRIDHLLSQ